MKIAGFAGPYIDIHRELVHDELRHIVPADIPRRRKMKQAFRLHMQQLANRFRRFCCRRRRTDLVIDDL